MSYTDKIKQNEFQVKWLRDRRLAWIALHGPCKCGQTENLRVAKNDPSVLTVKVFGWSESRRNEILAKCTVKCRKCLIAHNAEMFSKRYAGRQGEAERLTAETVWSIRGRLLGRETQREIARFYGLNHSTIWQIKTGKIWGWLKGGRRKVYGISKTGKLK